MRGRVVSRHGMIVVSALAMLVLAGCPYTKTDLHNAEDATRSAKRDWATEKADENFTRTRVDYSDPTRTARPTSGRTTSTASKRGR